MSYLVHPRCNYSTHVDIRHRSNAYANFEWITTYIGARNGDYQCCDYKLNLSFRIERSHYVTDADFLSEL